MCLTNPAKIIELNPPVATVETFDKQKNQIIISTIDSPRLNDWILFNANLAIKKIPEAEALEIIKLIKK